MNEFVTKAKVNNDRDIKSLRKLLIKPNQVFKIYNLFDIETNWYDTFFILLVNDKFPNNIHINSEKIWWWNIGHWTVNLYYGKKLRPKSLHLLLEHT